MHSDIQAFLEERAAFYNNPEFIETDPVIVPHRFGQKEDIEIAGFFAATLAWGNRVTIIRNSLRLMQLMGDTPYDFVMNHREVHLRVFDGFVHRTFQSDDAKYFVKALKYIYREHGGLQGVIAASSDSTSVIPGIEALHNRFFSLPHQPRTRKHLANPAKGSAAKRINMFLRWMVRNDKKGVDFGLWSSISPSALSCPLDVHSARVARKLNLLTRKQTDIKAVEELDIRLRSMDPHDPVKYDYALFGLGVFEQWA